MASIAALSVFALKGMLDYSLRFFLCFHDGLASIIRGWQRTKRPVMASRSIAREPVLATALRRQVA